MKYYKIITDNEFIGVINSNNFVAENPTNGWLFTSTEDLGQYVTYENKLYRDYWMQPIPQSTVQFTVAQITEINEEEYNSLVEAIINNEPIEVEQEDETPVPTEIIEEDPDITVEYVRDAKIKEMSTACRHTIEGGFDLELRGETYHFSLDTQDQLNLISLGTMAQTQSLIPYHADGQECTFYSAEEINEKVGVRLVDDLGVCLHPKEELPRAHCPDDHNKDADHDG